MTPETKKYETKVIDDQEVGRYQDVEEREQQIHGNFLAINKMCMVFSKKDREQTTPEQWESLKKSLLDNIRSCYEDAMDDELKFRGW